MCTLCVVRRKRRRRSRGDSCCNTIADQIVEHESIDRLGRVHLGSIFNNINCCYHHRPETTRNCCRVFIFSLSIYRRNTRLDDNFVHFEAEWETHIHAEEKKRNQFDVEFCVRIWPKETTQNPINWTHLVFPWLYFVRPTTVWLILITRDYYLHL